MFKLINLYSFLHFPAEEGRRKEVPIDSVSLIISDMPYPGSFHKDELLKIAFFWGKHDDIENESARIDKVRCEFIKFYGLEKKPRLCPPRQKIKRIVDRFLETGSVLPKTPPKVRVKTARTDENVARVEELIRADKSLSVTSLVGHPAVPLLGHSLAHPPR